MPAAIRFDHYEVQTRADGSPWELGRGAMGITYRAFDTNLQIPVALKVINTAALDTDSARERFVAEARAAAILRHRNVASVFHLGTGNGVYFYAMELIEGETVEALVRRQGPLPPRAALHATAQVARALNAAQQQGLVHRDIKPGNLMLVREDDEIAVKVIDFGLARSESAGAEEGVGAGGFVGTPHFASPEQLRNEALDARSDIYSLGATLWFMLTGQPPFTGALADVIERHQSQPVPLDTLAAAPAPLRELLARMLGKRAADRPATPAALREEIEAALSKIGADAKALAGSGSVEQEFATLVGTRPAPGADSPFQLGALLADRYRITGALGENNAGHLFRAQDTQSTREVRLLVLRSDWIEDKAAFTQLDREAEKASALAHPGVLRVFGLEVAEQGGFLVFEWTRGFTLLDLLRARQELEPAEVLSLLRPLADGLDHVQEAGLRRSEIALHQITVDFGENGQDAAQFLERPVAQWPDFSVKINPLGLTRDQSSSDTWAGGQTMVGNMRTMVGGTAAQTRDLAATDPGKRAIAALGTVVYELLGGTLLGATVGAGQARYTPLAPLTEAGNEVLRCALDTERSFPSATAFCQALDHPDSVELAPARPLPGSTLAPGPGPAATFAPAPLPPQKSGLNTAMLAVSILALAGGGYFFFRAKNEPPVVMTTLPSGETVPVEQVPPQPTPIPMTPEEIKARDLKAKIDTAEQLETLDRNADAINAWLDVRRAFPEEEVGRLRLEMLVDRIRARPRGISPEEFTAIREATLTAAEMGSVSAMMAYAENIRKTDPATAFTWFSKAAEKGQTAALLQLGLLHSNGSGTEKNLSKAVELFEQAVAADFTDALPPLAECLLYGKGVEKNEPRAIELLNKAVEKKHARAADMLASCYHRGQGVPKNPAEAARLYQLAVDGNYPLAFPNLGVLYMRGEGVAQNPNRAVELFQKGANLGVARSMTFYARCLEGAFGVGKDPAQARDWFLRAAQAGDPEAADWCKKNNIPIPTADSPTR